jgi:type I restriction enzyme, S subunit
VTSRNGDKVSIALQDEYEEAIVSQANTVFEISDVDKLLPEYLMMWFRRTEFDRYARFKSHGSAREIFDWNELCDTLLPIPAIENKHP